MFMDHFLIHQVWNARNANTSAIEIVLQKCRLRASFRRSLSIISANVSVMV